MLFELFKRRSNVAKIYEYTFKKKCLNASLINQGFYGFIYLIENIDNYKIIAKVYKKDCYMDEEACQLDMMRKYAIVRVPEIYSLSYKCDNGCFDVMFMEYISGVNASMLNITNDKEIINFSNQVVENLLAIHQISNPKGFGSYINDEYTLNWEEYYITKITNLYNAVHNGRFWKFSKKSLNLMDDLYDNFEKIFVEPVKNSSLIHGDYNLWNLIVNPENNELIGMIDPFGSCFADREIELFQLKNADGDKYKLLENYKSHIKLSDNFEIKSAYYSFWDDIKNMVNVGYCENKRFQEYGEFVKNHM